MTTPAAVSVTEWLATHPIPGTPRQLQAWQDAVRAELGLGALTEIVQLLEFGDPEQQYRALGAGRALGAEIWAEGHEPELNYTVALPGEDRSAPRRIVPRQQIVV